MKKLFALMFSLGLLQPLQAQKVPEKPKPTDDLKLIHAYNVALLEEHAKFWEQLAGKTRNSHQNRLYTELSENYRQLKADQDAYLVAMENKAPFHYERNMQHRNRNQTLLESAMAEHGNDSPKPPSLVQPRPPPAPTPVPTPVPHKRYTTESGFEVELRLEE